MLLAKQLSVKQQRLQTCKTDKLKHVKQHAVASNSISNNDRPSSSTNTAAAAEVLSGLRRQGT